MDYKNDVISSIKTYYIRDLTEMTGLSFHVEVKRESEGKITYGCYKNQSSGEYVGTADYEPGEVIVEVVCDDRDYSPNIKFVASTWKDLHNAVECAYRNEMILDLVRKRVSEAIID